MLGEAVALEVGADDEDLRAGVLDHRLQLGLRQAPVERDEDGAELGDREEQDRALERVAVQVGDARAGTGAKL